MTQATDPVPQARPAIISVQMGDENIKVTVNPPKGKTVSYTWEPGNRYELVLTEGSVFTFDTNTD